MTAQPRLIEVRANILKENDILARQLREGFQSAGVTVVSFVSSPGSGKTTFLEKLMARLAARHRLAALVGDLATQNDAVRLQRACPRVRQITTGTVCHLDAKMIAAALEGWTLEDLDFLFIENVGNLVCPSSYDLGEQMRVVLLSATEGEDKPLKYPTIFNTADVAMITKIDLAAAAEFDREAARRSILSVRPGMKILEVSAKSGAGMAEAEALFASLRAAAGRVG
ncbi:MAG TPA: hydrogenase nickel incorporation protein HypB [Acidobacteriaceae bacterium]|nr:hydrogenase nickel incorporation protein HypB [Acidobacteriaceae bacterium]